MFIEKDKPLPPLEIKENPIGVVLTGFLKADQKRQEVIGDVTEQTADIKQVETQSSSKLDDYSSRLDAAIKAHTSLKGPVHGETKTTVGLPNHDNWKMATIDEHKNGADHVFAHPAGLKELVNAKVKIDPHLYVPARVIPFSSGGILGEIPQQVYDCYYGNHIQPMDNPVDYIGETAFEFSTPAGMSIFPSMLGNRQFGRVTALPSGKFANIMTGWGGTKVRIYDTSIDIRRNRPSYLGGKMKDPTGVAMQTADYLWDPTCIFYKVDGITKVRGMNKNSLPFDIWDNGPVLGMYDGIFESREEFLYQFALSTKATNNDLGILLSCYPLILDQRTSAGVNSGEPLELTFGTTGGQIITWSLPAHGKIKSIPGTQGYSPTLSFALPDLITLTADQKSKIVTNSKLNRKICFAWRNRLMGKAALRFNIGWYSLDKTKYIHGWIDIEITMNHVDLNPGSACSFVVTTPPVWDVPKQSLDSNLEPVGTGMFKSYPVSVANDPLHPLISGGVFDPQGGHLKTFTLYNRQYVAHYRHEIKNTLGFYDLGQNPPKPITKFTYTAQPTINQDGFYGDHIRHIPVEINQATKEVTYLTQTRDWRNKYRWAFASVDGNVSPTLTQDGDYIGPKRTGLTWVEPSIDIPSFMIQNDDDSPTMNINGLVFTSKNKFKGFATYSLNKTDIYNPISFADPISVGDEILAWVAANAGGWQKTEKLYFMLQNNLYYFNQAMDPTEFHDDEDDCYYGVVKDCYIYTDPTTGEKTIKSRGSVASSVVVNSMKVNNKESLKVDQSTILGFDPMVAQDVYAQLISQANNISTYLIMVNLAPFNNFYFEMQATVNGNNGEVTFTINPNATDPIFQYDAVKGFDVNYDKLIQYGTKIPHRLHINYQTPVMLKKGMWSFRRTPNKFGFFTKQGFLLVDGQVMSSIPGVNIYPVGSILTTSGKNTIVKAPLNIYMPKEGLTQVQQEIFATLINGVPTLFYYDNNPNERTLNPSNGNATAGVLLKTAFSYHETVGRHNSLLPTIMNYRMNIFGYGSSIPVFLGKPGSGVPINRFYRP